MLPIQIPSDTGYGRFVNNQLRPGGKEQIDTELAWISSGDFG
ncbi:hypothetical protein Pla22_32830 [Rubripirellula amarantea]|uniref:Uncharacterized protein n=1 Tax=Rubripirellula amarantea TaxID=2527999 RepID=A0A5C5WIU4_9BACT|nr:hypothetical protein Pla22_32830 [Rubripirellula amarantea]